MINFFKDEEGATMVEYALMLSLIAIVCIVAVTAIGISSRTVFEAADASLQPAVAS